MPDPTPDTLHQIPLAEIDPAALTRDREGLDADALDELKTSIAASGLRMPIEVFPLAEPKPPHRYGLISGLRRLMAFQGLLELTGQPKYSTIPAFLRPPGTMAQTLASMVEHRYAGWSGDLGTSILAGQASLAELADRVESAEIDPRPVSGQQELYENVVNRHIWGADRE